MIRWKRQAEEAKKRKHEAAERALANVWATSWEAAQKKAAKNRRMRKREKERLATPHDPKVTNRRARQVARDVLQQRLQQPKKPWR